MGVRVDCVKLQAVLRFGGPGTSPHGLTIQILFTVPSYCLCSSRKPAIP